MTLPLNPQKSFGQGRSVIHLLAELEGKHRVVGALDYHNGRGDSFQFGKGVELRADQKVHAGKKPKQFAGCSGRRGKWRFKDEATNLAVCSDVGGYGGP